jgi:hypothetical protein
LTLYELAVPLERGDEAHFDSNRRRIEILYLPTDTGFFTLVGDFIRDRVFGLPIRRQDFHPDRLAKWGPVILHAKNKSELVSGGVLLGTPPDAELTYGFQTQRVAEQVDNGKSRHTERMEHIRANRLPLAKQEEWAIWLLGDIDVPITPQNVSSLMVATGAAYSYDMSLRREVQSASYDVGRWSSDWLDGLQVFYLSDPNVFFITEDTNISRRVAGSPQSGRVVLLKEFRDMVARGDKLAV